MPGCNRPAYVALHHPGADGTPRPAFMDTPKQHWKIQHMTLRTLMQAGPAKANELFTRLAETSGTALRTRERLFAELKGELEAHTDLEEQHLFPVLRKHAETKELVASAIRDNKELRGALAELDVLPKNDETFLAKLAELRRTFRQHARDEKKELLPAVQKALSEEQVQGITDKMETSLAKAEQTKQDQAEERRASARYERKQAEPKAEQEEPAEHESQAVARRTREIAFQSTEATTRTAEMVSESARQMTRGVTDSTQRVAAASAVPLTTGFRFWDMWLATSFRFWDMWLGMTGLQPSRPNPSRMRIPGPQAWPRRSR